MTIVPLSRSLCETSRLPRQRRGEGLDFPELQRALKLLPLTPGEERHELEKLHQTGSLEPVKKLVLHNLRFVLQMAHQFRGYGLPAGDLVQEGIVGLIKAIRSYDLRFEVRLITFASSWVKSEMLNYVLRHWRIVRPATTKLQKKLFFKMGRIGQEPAPRLLENKSEPSLTLAKQAKAHRQEASLKERLQLHEVPLIAGEQIMAQHWKESSPMLLEDHGSDFARNLEEQEWQVWAQRRLLESLRQLDERSANILRLRFQSSPPKSLKSIAEIYQLSIERVRQIEKKALTQLRESLKPSRTRPLPAITDTER